MREGAPRRAELISGVLCVTLTVMSVWCVTTLARLAEPAFENCGCVLPDATQYVFDFAEHLVSMQALPWLGGVFFVATGALLRRSPHTDIFGLVTLFLAPLAPLAMLAFSAIALLMPMIALATSGSLNT